MKEFINKLIGRLENHIKYCESCHEEFPNAKMSLTYEVQINAYKNAIEIVNELAEEYINTSTDTSTDTSSGWIPCSERLPEANQKVLTCDKDGWISVNVNIPYIGVRNDFECGYYVAWMPLPAPYKKGED